jgi:predicted  nucleic acid-binding Zn-ribbon protein
MFIVYLLKNLSLSQMPTKMIRSLTLFLIILTAGVSFAQVQTDTTAAQNSLKSGSITSQFEYIYRVSNNFQEYEVVKKSNLEQLKANVLDSIRTINSQLAQIKASQAGHADTLAALTAQMNQAIADKEAALEAQESFSFLGINIQKTVYSSMMWSLVAILAAALSFFAVQYFRSFGRIKKAEKDLTEVQEEFEQHRKNTLERERKLKRELIDAQMGKN